MSSPSALALVDAAGAAPEEAAEDILAVEQGGLYSVQLDCVCKPVCRRVQPRTACAEEEKQQTPSLGQPTRHSSPQPYTLYSKA